VASETDCGTEIGRGSVSFEDALAEVTAPGQRFELGVAEVEGIEQRVFVGAPESLRAIFDRSRRRGKRTFLVYEDERWSFEDVITHVDALGRLLVDSFGIKKGDRVAIAMRNYPEWIIAYAAITSVGGISVSLNAWWTEAEFTYAVSDCEPKLVIADRERIGLLSAACNAARIQIIGVRLGDECPVNVVALEKVIPLGATLPEVVIEPSDAATILYTSGTTGFPKGALSTHGAIVQALMGLSCRSAVERAREPLSASKGPAEPCFILVVPLFHVTGCIPVMLGSFQAGCKLVMMYRWDAKRALELIERERVTNFMGVAAHAVDLLSSPDLHHFDTSSLRMVAGGGGPVPPAVVKGVDQAFRKANPGMGYGMTETNAFGPSNSGCDYLDHPDSAGRSLPTMQVEIRDSLAAPVGLNQVGEIWLKGPSIIRGYWRDPDATARTIIRGWLRTGDVGRLDDKGFLYVEDRLKDIVIRGGENVHCAEVEAAMAEVPSVKEAVVFGVPHPRLGEEVAAIIVPREGESVDLDELMDHLAERVASFKIPSIVEIRSHVPRNAAGKVLKGQLRTEVSNG
jgi:long-chain acyl-CoA synthetase